jgi:hypothetical protein
MKRAGWVPVSILTAIMTAGTARAWETAKEGTFDGTWTIHGDTYSMEFGDEAEIVTVFRFTGPALIRTANGFAPLMKSECLGFTAPKTGTVGRCVLTDPEGDRVFCELSAAMTPGIAEVGGHFVAGTGKYRGISGTLRFQAQTGRQVAGRDSTGQTMTIFGSWLLP